VDLHLRLWHVGRIELGAEEIEEKGGGHRCASSSTALVVKLEMLLGI